MLERVAKPDGDGPFILVKGPRLKACGKGNGLRGCAQAHLLGNVLLGGMHVHPPKILPPATGKRQC